MHNWTPNLISGFENTSLRKTRACRLGQRAERASLTDPGERRGENGLGRRACENLCDALILWFFLFLFNLVSRMWRWGRKVWKRKLIFMVFNSHTCPVREVLTPFKEWENRGFQSDLPRVPQQVGDKVSFWTQASPGLLSLNHADLVWRENSKSWTGGGPVLSFLSFDHWSPLLPSFHFLPVLFAKLLNR